MRVARLLLLLWGVVSGVEITPKHTYLLNAAVSELSLEGSTLWAATAEGRIERFNTKRRTLLNPITLPDIKDFMGEIKAPRLFSIDALHSRLLVVSEGERGYRKLYFWERGHLELLIDSPLHLVIQKARFVTPEKAVLGLLGGEVLLYDIPNKRVLKRLAIRPQSEGGSALSDIVLNRERTLLITADESGQLFRFRLPSLAPLTPLSGANVDRVYRVDTQKDIIITAGQDRRCGLYREGHPPYYIQSDFLVYAAALTPSARFGIYSADAANTLALFAVATKRVIATLRGHNGIINDLVMPNDAILFSAGEERRILEWDLSPITDREQP